MTRAEAIAWQVGCILGAAFAVAVVEVFRDQLRRCPCQR